jgi:cytochrome b pre-mRNA-processing protein 3
MTILSRLFRIRPDPREALRPLWHRIVAISRQEHWYASDGVADSIAGRFDMIAAIVVLVLLRIEREEAIADRAALLTELFVEDMDGQLREKGVGDLVVGKHVGRLVSVLGGRLGAFRSALASGDTTEFQTALGRNMTMLEGAGPQALAEDLRQLFARLVEIPGETLLAGEIPA